MAKTKAKDRTKTKSSGQKRVGGYSYKRNGKTVKVGGYLRKKK